MKKSEVIAEYRAHILPGVVIEYERAGIPDKPARREAFNNFVDSLAKEGRISWKLADSIVIPDELETCALTWQEIENYKNSRA